MNRPAMGRRRFVAIVGLAVLALAVIVALVRAVLWPRRQDLYHAYLAPPDWGTPAGLARPSPGPLRWGFGP